MPGASLVPGLAFPGV